MKLAAVLAVAVLAIGVLWLAGEKHLQNCRDSQRSACSVFPWVGGERKTYTREECMLLREAAAQPFSEVAVPEACK